MGAVAEDDVDDVDDEKDVVDDVGVKNSRLLSPQISLTVSKMPGGFGENVLNAKRTRMRSSGYVQRTVITPARDPAAKVRRGVAYSFVGIRSVLNCSNDINLIAA